MAFTRPDKLELAQLKTPLQPLSRLSKRLGGPMIWVKRDDLTATLETGNKIRKLEFVFAKLLSEGCDTVITCGGTQSNHCRATAAVAARLGLQCHLLLRDDTSQASSHEVTLARGNLLLDHLFGARVSVYEKRGFGRLLDERVMSLTQHYSEQGHKAYFVPTGASDGVGLWGYIHAAEELAADFQHHGIQPATIVCASGSGGTQAGLTLGVAMQGLSTRVIGMAVCDDAQYFNQKVQDDWADWSARYAPEYVFDTSLIETDDRYIGEGYGLASDDIYALIVDVARTEGVVLDPTYTAKAFAGLLENIKLGEYSDAEDVVFIHTGGVYGLLAQAERLVTHL